MRLSNNNPVPVQHDNRQYHNVVAAAAEKAANFALEEQLQRVEEWARKSYNPQPIVPNYERAPATSRNIKVEPVDSSKVGDLEALSELIIEGVRLMDSRDHLIASKPPTANKEEEYEELIFDAVEQPNSVFDDVGVVGLGKQFRESKLAAKQYVKQFENKVNQKRFFESAIFNTFPYLKTKKGPKGKNLIPVASKNTLLMMGGGGGGGKAQYPIPQTPVVMEPDAWRHKASRSIHFSMKYTSEPGNKGDTSQHNDVADDKWSVKRENDKDWWRWKLKQRVIENDELLQKLVDQRHMLESTFIKPGTAKPKSTKDIGKAPSATPSAVQSFAPFSRSTSRHVTVEFTQGNKHPEPSRTTTVVTKLSGRSTREPIPSFYSPSKEAQSGLLSASGKQDDPSILQPPNEDPFKKQPKLKTLKKDPYLAKLLAGNEMFKPEIMLEANQPPNQRTELSHHHHHHKSAVEYGNPRRKISLESLTDSTDDEITAAKFFNPDVKVLYERLSDMEVDIRDKFPVGDGFSREPSDGFLNLPILLATGRFNRYNKIPSMKGVANNQSPRGTFAPVNSRQSRKSKSGRIRSNKFQKTIANKMKRDNFIVSKMGNMELEGLPKVFLGKSKSPSNNKIENLSTKDWAKRLMQKMKQQSDNSASPKTVDDETLTESDDDLVPNNEGRLTHHQAMVGKLEELDNNQMRKYKVPIDQETNILYHEILMSKWKKDKHDNRDKDIGTVGAVVGNKDTLEEPQQKKTANCNTCNPKAGAHQNQKHVHHHHQTKQPLYKKDNDKTTKNDNASKNNARPKGLDIWLENIREKAKRDRLVSPLPNAAGIVSYNDDDDVPASKGNAPSLMTAFENSAFRI